MNTLSHFKTHLNKIVLQTENSLTSPIILDRTWRVAYILQRELQWVFADGALWRDVIRKPSGQHTEGGVGGQEAQGNPGESHILMLCFGAQWINFCTGSYSFFIWEIQDQIWLPHSSAIGCPDCAPARPPLMDTKRAAQGWPFLFWDPSCLCGSSASPSVSLVSWCCSTSQY